MGAGGVQPHFEALYYLIAQDAIRQAEEASDEFARKKHIAVTLVFAALCLEAHINQAYSAIHVPTTGQRSLLSSASLLSYGGRPWGTSAYDGV